MKNLIIIPIILFSSSVAAQTYTGGFQSSDGTIYTSTYDSQQSSRDSALALQQYQDIAAQQQEQRNEYYQQQQQIEEYRYQQQINRQ